MKKNLMELGRSMVEMLGVLAIIGVLSIVGIQGYKKAMNKIKANDVMDIAMKVWHEAQAWYFTHPGVTPTEASLCSNAVPDTVANTSSWRTWCNKNNLGMDKPSWATLDSFAVRVNMKANNNPDYYFMALTGMGSKDVCLEIFSMLEKNGADYRVKGTNTTAIPRGLVVQCYTSTNDEMVTGRVIP